MSVMGLIWPRVFDQPIEAPYRPEETAAERRKMATLADQLMAWANCHMEKPPENFGMVMIKLGKITGCMLPDECMAESAKHIADRKE